MHVWGPSGLAAGDLDHDGHVDLAVASGFGHTVSIQMGNGAGGFSRQIDMTGNTYPAGEVLTDLNDDGALDLVTTNPNYPTLGTVSTFLGLGTGSS